MQLTIQKNQKEIKEHGNYAFPVHVSYEAIQNYECGNFLWHWHPEIELTWILSGQMEYFINEKRYILTSGEGIFANSGALHAGYMIDGQDCDYISITFHPRFIYGYENSVLKTKYVDTITTDEAWQSLKLNPDTDWQNEILHQVQELYQLSQTPPEDYELQTHLLLTSIWQKLYQYHHSLPTSNITHLTYLQRLKDILTYLQEHFAEDISLADVAIHTGLCKSECCRFFKKHMKMTIFDYLLSLRIQNSLPLLASGRSITEIAGLVGFSSSSYYSQVFRRQMGCAPSQYRSEYMG